MKKILIFLLGIIIGVLPMTITAYAHNKDVFAGSYTLNQQKNLTFRITGSAQTTLMNEEVYNGALKWNNISKNVRVSIIMETPGMPTVANAMYVYDGRGGNLSGPNLLDDYELGYTYYYDSNHNRVSHDDICAYVKIIINTETSAYNGLTNAKQAASMNFIHEVGHALMLMHPINLSAFEGHNLNGGYPYAVMNRGLPTQDWPHVSSIPTEHDKSCLTAKWGK